MPDLDAIQPSKSLLKARLYSCGHPVGGSLGDSGFLLAGSSGWCSTCRAYRDVPPHEPRPAYDRNTTIDPTSGLRDLPAHCEGAA